MSNSGSSAQGADKQEERNQPERAAHMLPDPAFRRIASRDNPTFRELERIRKAPQRAEPPLLFLEGLRLCADAVRSGVPVSHLIVSEQGARRTDVRELASLAMAGSPEAELVMLADHLFGRLTATEEPQGIAMFCRQPLRALDRVPADPNGLYLVLEGVADPGNVGTLVRTADAFAFSAILILPQTASPFGDKAVRSAMGSCLHVPIIALDSVSALRGWLDQAGLALYTADLSGRPLTDRPFTRPGAILIGSEAHGVSQEARAACDTLVTIPMPGQAESLNAAVAGAILCYSLRNAIADGEAHC